MVLTPISKGMSDESKPLIFLEPLSDTLKQLKQVFEENAESEGIELYEVDDLEEAGQLIPNLGQSLILTASPKKCAMMLQQNRRAIKGLQSKTILLSPKAIPRKTLDKFMKVGLTECVIEPVNPKTLLYKVRLQLRSIKTASEEEAEMSQKFGEEATQAAEATSKKVRSSKEAEVEEEDVGKTKSNQEEVVLEDYSKSGKKNYQEESIENYYKGKQKKSQSQEQEEEEDKEKKGYKEEVIEGHYKGKVAKEAQGLESEEGEDLPSAKEIEEDIESLKHKINLEVEEDLAAKKKKNLEVYEEAERKKKKAASIDIDEEDDNSSKNKEAQEDLGGHYKGKVGQKPNVEASEEEVLHEKEEESAELYEKKKKASLVLEDDNEDFLDKDSSPEEEALKKAKRKKLELIDGDEDDELVQKAESEEVAEDDPGIEKDEFEGHELESPKKDRLAVVDDEDKDRKEKNKTDDIDGYLRGGAAKKVKSQEGGEDLYEDEAGAEEARGKRARAQGLYVEEDLDSRDPITQEGTEESTEDLYKKKARLSVLEDSSEGDSQEHDEEEAQNKDLSAKSKLDVEDDELKRKSLNQAQKSEGTHNRSDARADHIKTHYSSKESTKHNDDDWDAKWDKKKKEGDDALGEKREEKSLIFDKKDLGEQTIDYAQLKKEFAAGSYEGVANKKKTYGEFHEVAEVKTYTKTILSVEGAPEQMEFEEVSREQKEGVEGAQVFEPQSLGIEIAIEVQCHYMEEDVDSYKICEFIQDRLSSEFSGDLVVYKNSKGNEVKPLFNGRVAKQLIGAPVKLTDADFEGVGRAEKRQMEADYQEDFKAYGLKKREVEGSYNQSWGTKLDQWKEFKTPSFRDQTFQEIQNEFIFPFYEGISLLGIGVFIPTTRFNPEQARSLEVVFEVMRGFLLTEYHHESGATQTREKEVKSSKEKSNEKAGGFFGKLFGKKAG